MGLQENAAVSSMMGKRINRIPLLSSTPSVRISSNRRVYMTFAVLLIGSRSVALGRGIQGGRGVSIIISHKLFHGIGWLLFGKGRTCRTFLGISHYLAGRLLPLWTIGIIGIIVLFIYPGTFSFVSAEFILILSGVDIAEAFSIFKNVNYSDRKI